VAGPRDRAWPPWQCRRHIGPSTIGGSRQGVAGEGFARRSPVVNRCVPPFPSAVRIKERFEAVMSSQMR
jgi:hypothetical protein